MKIKIESGAKVQITDKPIINVFGDVNVGNNDNPAKDDAAFAEYEEVPEVISEESPSLIEKCFKFNNTFVKDTVNTVVRSFYNGSHADLALIEVSLFDHGQLRKRNAHKAFVKSLIAWGILDKVGEEELKQIQKGIIDKFRHLPKEGYMQWGDSLLNDKNTCISIGKKLGPTMKYCR